MRPYSKTVNYVPGHSVNHLALDTMRAPTPETGDPPVGAAIGRPPEIRGRAMRAPTPETGDPPVGAAIGRPPEIRGRAMRAPTPGTGDPHVGAAIGRPPKIRGRAMRAPTPGTGDPPVGVAISRPPEWLRVQWTRTRNARPYSETTGGCGRSPYAKNLPK